MAEDLHKVDIKVVKNEEGIKIEWPERIFILSLNKGKD